MPRARIVKWGNSLAVRIPKAIVEALHLRAGDSLVIEASRGRIELRRSAPTLSELVAGVTPENCFGEIEWGPNVGKEIVEW
jgi:antitoxin MazE